MRSGIIPPMISLLQAAALPIKKEVAWTVCNFCMWGTRNQIKTLVDSSCIRGLCDMLDSEDNAVLLSVVEALLSILKVIKFLYNCFFCVCNLWGSKL